MDKNVNNLKNELNITMTTFFGIILLFLLLFPYITFAESSFLPPSWMKQGCFVEYTFEWQGYAPIEGSIIVFQKPYCTATLRWECLKLNGNFAILNVSLLSNKINFSNKVFVNLTNQDVFLQNETYLGKTLLWGPVNPSQNDTVKLWSVDSSTNSSTVIGNVNIQGCSRTPQGYQEIYVLGGKGMIRGSNTIVNKLYDLNTGVMTDGRLVNEPMLLSLNISDVFRIGPLTFSSTNIDLGSCLVWPEILELFPFILLGVGVALFLGFVTLVHKRRIKNTQLKRTKTHNKKR
jgi:hypothetical protein